MKTFKQFVEGIDDDLKGDLGAMSQAYKDEKANPVIPNRKKGKKLLDRLLGPFTDKV
tara:strand:+ start:460 stop:630 length:171 start_codon:yes stop_codon:yes gene_type:complete